MKLGGRGGGVSFHCSLVRIDILTVRGRHRPIYLIMNGLKNNGHGYVPLVVNTSREYMSKRPHFLPKRPHYFFRIKIILPKRPHFFIAKTTRLIYFFLLKRWYHVWYLVIQDLFSKSIYCIYMFSLHQKTANLYIYAPVIVSYIHLSLFYLFCLATIKYRLILNCCRPTSLLHWLLFLYSAWNNNLFTDTNFLETRNDYVNRN